MNRFQPGPIRTGFTTLPVISLAVAAAMLFGACGDDTDVASSTEANDRQFDVTNAEGTARSSLLELADLPGWEVSVNTTDFSGRSIVLPVGGQDAASSCQKTEATLAEFQAEADPRRAGRAVRSFNFFAKGRGQFRVPDIMQIEIVIMRDTGDAETIMTRLSGVVHDVSTCANDASKLGTKEFTYVMKKSLGLAPHNGISFSVATTLKSSGVGLITEYHYWRSGNALIRVTFDFEEARPLDVKALLQKVSARVDAAAK